MNSDLCNIQWLHKYSSCPPSPKILLCVHTSRIITPSNIRSKLPTCYNTSEEPSQACIQIFYHISEASGAPSHISEYSSFLKHAYSEYLILFTHAPQTVYRIFKDLRIFPISLPQHSRCIGTHLRRFLLRETIHRHILRNLSAPITPASLFAPFEV